MIKLENIIGLSANQIPLLQQQFGKNVLSSENSRHFINISKDIVKEPMFILLLIACSLYFILGETSEGFLMLIAMILVSAISLYQEIKSTNAIEALQQYTQPQITVIRDGKEINIPSAELVPGDIVLLDEGMNVPADVIILQGNDLSVNESIITGESLAVEKNESERNNLLFHGTTINSGRCIAQVTAIGNNTALGKLGKAVGDYHQSKTLLQLQMAKFLRLFALFGLVGFLIIFLMNFFQQHAWTTSLLFALTLAMSVIPEEIPVAFSSFMALGAFKMSKLGIISRQPQTVENLGAVSVFCFDKTGTITENNMYLKIIYSYSGDSLIELPADKTSGSENILYKAVLASETDPFDPMEKAIVQAWQFHTGTTSQPLKMIFEYPLEGKPPMMTHVYEDGGAKIVAAKGAAERIMQVCKLNDLAKKEITRHIHSLASKGYRIIGVASALHTDAEFPKQQDDFNWKFEGLLGLYDPPKKNISVVLKQIYAAGIEVKLITGDYPETAMNIAGQVGIQNSFSCINGDEVMKMEDIELKKAVKNINIFARMYPGAKVKVINALKENGEIVAMTGDGVNDGPALKSASIGIAMGYGGTEIARQASGLILTDDNLEKLVIAVSEGRKIFSNLKKAIRYIISIHIPIILIASLPLLLGWKYPNIFTPVHVIFLELIMGPTCSVFFEREPMEENLMLHPPRSRNDGVLTKNESLLSILQGVIIALGILSLYYYFMKKGANLEQIRTIVFTTLIVSNIFLTFSNRSFTKTLYQTTRYKNSLAPIILIISVLFLITLQMAPTVRNLFHLSQITFRQFSLCLIMSFVSVIWFEAYKIIYTFNPKNDAKGKRKLKNS